MATPATIALVGDFDPSVTAHVAIPKALDAAGVTGLQWVWVPTESIQSEADIARFDAVWCVPDSPYRNEVGAIIAIRHARESGKPFLGTCGGYQHAVLEYTRNVLGHTEASNVEVDPNCTMPVIGALTCALIEQSGDVTFTERSKLASLFGATANEGYHCSYGVNADYLGLFDATPLAFSGFDQDGDPRALELDGHPFFIGTAFQPERAALEGRAHPLINAFAQAVTARHAQQAV